MPNLSKYIKDQQSDSLIDIQHELTKLFPTLIGSFERCLELPNGLECFTDVNDLPTPIVPIDALFPMVSNEGFSEVLKNVWETIKQWFQKLIKWFLSLADETKLEVATIRFKASNLKIHARNELAKTVNRRDPLIMNTHVAALSVLYSQPRDISVLSSWLGMLNNTLSSYYQYTDDVAFSGLKGFVNSFQRLTPELNQHDLEQYVIDPVSKFTPDEFIKKLGDVKKITNTVKLGPQMLGNVRFKIETPVEGHSELRKLNEYKIALTTAETTPRVMPQQITIPRFSLHANDQVIDQVLKLCDLLDKSSRINQERTRVIDKLITSIDRFVDKAYKTENGTSVTRNNAEQLIRLSRQITQWVTPLPGTIGITLRTSRGTLILCEKNLK